MTRQVAHGEKKKGGRVCECGATFKTNRLLKKHLADVRRRAPAQQGYPAHAVRSAP